MNKTTIVEICNKKCNQSQPCFLVFSPKIYHPTPSSWPTPTLGTAASNISSYQELTYRQTLTWFNFFSFWVPEIQKRSFTAYKCIGAWVAMEKVLLSWYKIFQKQRTFVTFNKWWVLMSVTQSIKRCTSCQHETLKEVRADCLLQQNY